MIIEIKQAIELDDDGIHCGNKCPGMSETGNGDMNHPILYYCTIFKKNLFWGKWKSFHGWVERCPACLAINNELTS